MTKLEILIAARALIADPAKWTYGAAARDEHGVKCHPLDKGAVCFCAIGAIEKAAEGMFVYNLNELDFSRSKAMVLNDREGHAAVLAYFDKVIAENQL